LSFSLFTFHFQVLPTHKDRLAVTVWFFDAVEKRAANEAADVATAAAAGAATAT
jgi:hypothetical protein